MTDQHRASPADWLLHAASLDDADSSCLLELRARVEALEATQHAHADLSRLSDAEREQVTQELAKPVRVFTAKEVAPIVAPATRVRFISEVFQAASAEAQPAGGLVERVAEGIAAADDEGLTNMTWNHHARAAIREVAAWLRENDSECQMGGDAAATAELLEQEASHG
jgi:hypothetical protein